MSLSSPLSLCDRARSFLKATQSILADIDEADAAVTARLAQLQSEFQGILASISAADLRPETESQIRPCLTEGHRRLRLLSVAAMQMRTAKQPETLERVRSQIGDHLTQLQKFVAVMVDALCKLD